MKKLILFSSLPILSLPLPFVISCSKSTPDYYQMSWSVDQEKVEELKKSGWESFNSEANTVEKILKVIKSEQGWVEKYTKQALEDGWFKKIEFENNNGKPGKLVFELLKEKSINGKNKNCPYKLPNGSYEAKY